MKIQVEELGAVVVVTPQGERLDAVDASGFKGQMVDLVNQGHNRLILDLSQVQFMDSSGLGAMLSSLKTINSSGGKLAVVGVGGHLSSLFRITKLEKIIPIYDSTEKARKALA